MTHKRNTEAVVERARQKSIDAAKKVETAITGLLKAKESISVAKVAEHSGVSRQWIYKNEPILGRIQRLIEQQAGTPRTPPKRSQSRSEASKDSIIEVLKSRIKALEDDNRTLKLQLEAAYGQLYDK